MSSSRREAGQTGRFAIIGLGDPPQMGIRFQDINGAILGSAIHNDLLNVRGPCAKTLSIQSRMNRPQLNEGVMIEIWARR